MFSYTTTPTMSTKAIIAPIAFCVTLMLVAWHLTQLMLGLEYRSNTCDVPLAEWNIICGAVGLGLATVVLLSGCISLPCPTVGFSIFTLTAAVYSIGSIAAIIYGYVLAYSDDGLRCKLDDHNHDRSLWIYSICVMHLQNLFIFGGAVTGNSQRNS